MMLIFSQSGLTSPIATALIIRMACLYFKWKLKRGRNAEAALPPIYRPRGTLNILLFVHMLSVCAFSWPFSSTPLSYSSSFFLSVLPWVSSPSHRPSLHSLSCVCMYPLHGEVADGSMGSRKSAPVLVSSARQSSDNWIIILPVGLSAALRAASLLPFTSSDCLFKVCSVAGFNLILPRPADGPVCRWCGRCSQRSGVYACVFPCVATLGDFWLSQGCSSVSDL